MPSAWIRKRTTKAGATRYDVQYRTGGRETPVRYAGAFRTHREARIRRDAVAGELAALRVPDVRAAFAEAVAVPTFTTASRDWLASRIDVAESTRTGYFTPCLNRARPLIGEIRLDEIGPNDVAGIVTTLHERGAKRGTIRKTLNVVAQVLDHAGVEPNPARDRRVRLPHEDRPEIEPPTAEHVEAVLHVLAPEYRLPVITLETTGMRIGELETLTWGDVDVIEGRWRVARARSKTNAARWVQVPADVLAAVCRTCPLEDRLAERRVFPDVTQAAVRIAISRACKLAGVPVFSPHDLRHRRISLWHREGVPWASIGERVGQRRLSTTADTYTHVITEGEVDYAPFVR